MTASAPVTDVVTVHGEGAVWFGPDIGLRLVDMLAGDVLTLGADGQVDRLHVGSIAATLRPRRSGGFVVATEAGFALWDETGPEREIGPIWVDPDVRMNEGACDPDGRFYAGSMAYDAAPHSGKLYRLDTDGHVETILSDVTISNGLDWSPEGDRAYYADTPTGRVDIFDYDVDAGLTNRRTLVTIDAGLGAPDGLTVDSEGGVWVALWQGGAVHRYEPGGALSAVVDVPVSQVTSCTFGGTDLGTLFVTTSRFGEPPDALAGAVFGCSPGVTGVPTRPFHA